MNADILDFISQSSAQKPQVTLSYAQSLDGSIALQRGQPTAISGPESLRLTHQLRARHDAILVGIGTLLADDPNLNAREVEGPDPQPLILDSRLRFPLDAKVLAGKMKPWIFCTPQHDSAKRAQLEEAGARVFPIEAAPDGRVALPAFLRQLAQLDLARVMLEGGASLIAGFLAQGLVSKAVITIAPIFIGGLKAFEAPISASPNFPRLHGPQLKQLGDDLILWGAVQPS